MQVPSIPTVPKPAAVYTRVSTTEQSERGYSLPTQLDTCLKQAQEDGYTVTHVFQEDYTGTSLHRPQLTQLRDLVRQRLIEAVVIYDQDRLSRKLAHLLLLGEGLFNIRVTWYRLLLACCRIAVDVMTCPVTFQHTTRCCELPDQLAALHRAISFVS